MYKLHREPLVLDGIVFVGGSPIDDRNIESSRLGIRRLKSKYTMEKLNIVCFNFSDLVKRLTRQDNWFIDTSGHIFKYIRTSNEAVKSHYIEKTDLRDTYSVVTLKGIDYPFIVSSPPRYNYARVLYYKDIPWMILDIEPKYRKPSYKKV